ncbi:MAG: hypothetical protein QOF11_270 [Chloroflexota bacterium]|jgi:hypothetical protein|nr:hypothetical protein [Chloroflexota bacterium]
MLGGDGKSYGDSQPNDTSPWVLLRDFDKLASSDGTWVRVAAIAKRYKSSSPDSEAFIHDPLSVMMADAQNPETGETEALAELARIGPDWPVSTLVVNHQATLSIKHLTVVVTLKPDNPSVGVLIVKQNQ